MGTTNCLNEDQIRFKNNAMLHPKMHVILAVRFQRKDAGFVDESAFHPIKETASEAWFRTRDCTVPPGGHAALVLPYVKDLGTTSVEPRNTAVNRCPTQAPPVAARVVCDVFGQPRSGDWPAGWGCQLETLGSC